MEFISAQLFPNRTQQDSSLWIINITHVISSKYRGKKRLSYSSQFYHPKITTNHPKWVVIKTPCLVLKTFYCNILNKKYSRHLRPLSCCSNRGTGQKRIPRIFGCQQTTRGCLITHLRSHQGRF